MNTESKVSVVCYLWEEDTLVFLLRDDHAIVDLTEGYPLTWVHEKLDVPAIGGLKKYLLPEEWVP